MAFALPLAASAMAAAAPAAAAAATKVTLMAVAKSVLMNVAISAAMSALQPQVGSAGRTFEWTLDPNAPIPFAAGRVGVAGTVAHLETYGPDKMYYGFVSILSGAGPIRGITGFKGDDEVVAFDGNGKAVSSQWAGEMWMRSRLGTQPDTALTNPPGLKNNAQLPGWTAAHKLSGKACYMLVLGENSKRTAYPTGEPKPLVTVEGLYGWDPRQDSTYPGGAGPCRLNNPATWVWLDNPILWGLKWALGLWEGPTGKGAPGVDYQVGGIGAKVEGIRVDRFVAAANVADANGWKVAAYPTTDDDKSQVLDSFLQAGGAIYAQEQGKISCIQRAAPRASIVTITAADTAGPLEIDTAASRIDRINTIRPRFWSEAHRWQMTAIDDVTADPYRIEDGAVRPRGIDYPYVPLATQAAQLAGLQIANTREPIAGTIPLKPHLRNIAPGTAFTISEPGFLLDGLKCLCLNSDYDPATGVVSVTFVSETDAKYPFALGQSPIPPAAPVLTAPDLTVTAPQPGEWSMIAANFVNDGVSVPALLFSGSVENSRAISVIFEFRPIGAADWSGAGIEDPTIARKEAAGGLLTPGVQYEGAVSYRVGGNISTRLVLGPVTAGPLTAGEVAPVTPANVVGTPGIAITSTISPDGTVTSRLYGDWGDAADAASYLVELSDGSITRQIETVTSDLTDVIVRIGGNYSYRVKARSVTGHLSGAWSNWSAVQIASGDATAPGPVGVVGGAGNGVFPLVRQIGMAWANPVVSDLARVLIYRNTSGTSPQVTGEASYGWSEGTRFFDGQAALGTTYHYWALTQDRSGNASWASLVYLGFGQARRVSVAADDVLATDPLLVTGYGIASGIAGQGPGATAPADQVLNNKLDGGVVIIPKPVGGAAYFSLAQTGAIKIALPQYYSTGFMRFAVDIYNYSTGSVQTYEVGGHDDAGTVLWHSHFATFTGAETESRAVRFGHDGSKTCVWIGETAASWSYLSIRIRDFIKASGTNLNVDAWDDGWAISLVPAFGTVQRTVAKPRSGDAVFGEGVFEAPGGVVATRPNFRTDQGISQGIAGQGALATKSAANFDTDVSEGVTYRKYLAVERTKLTGVEDFATVGGVFGSNIRETIGGTVATLPVFKTSQGIASGIAGQGPGATATADQVLNNRLEDGVVVVPRPVGGSRYFAGVQPGAIKIALPQYFSTGFIRFAVDIYNYSTGAVQTYEIGGHDDLGSVIWHNFFATFTGAETESKSVRLGHDGTKACVWIGEIASVWSYLSVRVRDFTRGGPGVLATVDAWDDGWAVSLVAAFNTVQRTVAKPRSGDAVFGEGVFESPGGAVATRPNFRTDQGISQGIAGQTAWATHSASVQRIQYLDDAGRIIDGRGLPLNAASGAGLVLDPTTPLSPGTNTSTQIAVAATTVTLVGGQVINIAASTISGLTANTAYAVFYDLLTSSCVAISSAATSYYTSANRYLALGYYRTAQAGGTYSPPPAPPPWGGGGVGNCADEDSQILMANADRSGPGGVKRFGDLRPGDWVWTQHEQTDAWGAFEVEAVSLAEGEPCCLLTLEDGRSLPVTPDHRVRVAGAGFVHAKDLRFGALVLGPVASRLADRTYAGRRTVVKATIAVAHTYVANGMLSHNIKYVEP